MFRYAAKMVCLLYFFSRPMAYFIS